MSLLCDWCQYTNGFYASKPVFSCDKNHTEFVGRTDDCPDFKPFPALIKENKRPWNWDDFKKFYGEPHPNVAAKIHPTKIK